MSNETLPRPILLGLYLGPQNPVDRGQTGVLASALAAEVAAREAPLSPGRTSSGLFSSKRRPLTANPVSRATLAARAAAASGRDDGSTSPRPGSGRSGPPSPGSAKGLGASGAISKTRYTAPPSPPQRGPMNGGTPPRHSSTTFAVQHKYNHETLPRGVKMRGLSRVDHSEEAGRSTLPATDEDVQRNIRKWYHLMQKFKKTPDSVEFVYLRFAEPDGAVGFHPYSLLIVEHAGIKGQRDYMTMSSKGVTRFWAGQTDFVSLTRFEREYFMYMQLVKLFLFRSFRAWKAFRVWRKGVALTKARQCRDQLRRQLFAVTPAHRGALLRIKSACEDLQALRLHALQMARTYTLDEFKQLHKEQLALARGVLEEFGRNVLFAVHEACGGVLAGMEDTISGQRTTADLGTAVMTGRSSSRPGSPQRPTSVRVALVRATQAAQDDEFAYAMNAARRSEKRRIHNFVRMLDYITCTALHALLDDNCSDILAALTPSPVAAEPEPDPAALKDAASKAAQAVFGILGSRLEDEESVALPDAAVLELDAPAGPPPTWGGPVFTLQVLLQDGTDKLVFEPPIGDFLSAVDGFLAECCTAVLAVSRLSTAPELQDFIEMPIEGSGFDNEGFNDIVIGDPQKQLESKVMSRLREALNEAEELRVSLEPFRDMVVAYRAVTVEALRADVLAGRQNLDRFHDDFKEYKRQQAAVHDLPQLRDLGVLRIELSNLLESFAPAPDRCLDVICGLLPELAAGAYLTFSTKVHESILRLSIQPTTAEEFAEYLEFQVDLEADQKNYTSDYDEVVDHYLLMKTIGIRASDMENAAYQTLEADVSALRDAMYAADAGKARLVVRFRGDLEEQVESLGKEVLDIRLLAQHDMLLDDASSAEAVLAYTKSLGAKIAQQREQAARINKHQRMFKLEESKWNDLDDCADDVALRHDLWTCRVNWLELVAGWGDLRLDQTDVAVLDEHVLKYHRTVLRMERGLVPNKVVPTLRASINAWRDFVPVVQSLCNPDMKERHWGRVNSIVGRVVDRGESLTLSVLNEMKIADHRDALALLSTEATQEGALEIALNRVHDKWKLVEFTLNPYKELKEAYTLGGVEEVAAVLEDSLIMMMTISASRFASGIRAEVEKTEKQLRVFSDTLDEWLDCQRQWLNLETIFGASDIQRQLPTEAKAFSQVDKLFRDVMRKTKDRPNALQACTQIGLLEMFQRCNQSLEMVQKNLELYLETKRVAFPRFYFLSNEELLEILSQTRNPQTVQPHLQKCFDGVRLLDFGGDQRGIDIFAMLSAEGERVALGKNLKARGPVESWLTNTEASMRFSLRAMAKRGAREYPTATREEWILAFPAQIVIIVSNIFWCQYVESCLSHESDSVGAMMTCYEVNVAQLGSLIRLVRTALSPLERKVVCALITIDVHNRDIVGMLVERRTAHLHDFNWQMQLRYELEAEHDKVLVRQVNVRFEYGFEYLGAQPRLVVTPMTDRCYLTLTGALHMKLGGAPAGPAGTGKTETTKDLGKALGIQCVVFNCGDNLDYKFMGKFFSGLAQCGAWACFDEFNRIDIEVLSVVAQQLLSIQTALRGNMDRFMFEGREMRLLHTCGVFITMNPGYAGRTELPDNLKALFRPMSMMIPDYALVAEVMLFSEGFSDARRLSIKMVKLYKLASEQLSQQDHYDFGMRALKSVLVMAGTSKRSEHDLPEDIVLIRAMRDANVPKFLAEDARLFDAIVGDLFPGVELPELDHGALQLAVSACCVDVGLQAVPGFVTKVMQLHETFNVRFGVMLVGPTGGGKTQAYKMLQAAMGRLRHEEHADPNYQVLHTHLVNPKAIGLGELYGQHSSLTNEWTDGLASSIMRAAVAAGGPDLQWVIFDGPVDALWVENLNTVLDDNCMLCLPNGERIKLNATTMRMLFEVQDLAFASPATVSRCGMVYVPPEDLGWRPFIRSWLNRLALSHLSGSAGPSDGSSPVPPGPIHSSFIDYVWSLFHKFIDPLLKVVNKTCHKAIPLPDINMVTSVAMLFQAMTQPKGNVQLLGTNELDELRKIALGYIFCFCCIWGIGGCLEAQSWDAFDHAVRGLFEGTANFPVAAATVFEYSTDPNRNHTFVSWEASMAKYKYEPTLPYFQILVPTVETTRYSLLLQLLLACRHSALFVGGSGVGKSAIMMDALNKMQTTSNVVPVVFNFSARTSSVAVQAMLEARLERKRKRLIGAPAGKHVVLFIDDVNMPTREEYGAQPPIELLRLLQDCRGFYDRKKLFWKDVDETTLCAACGTPGGGRQDMTPRFTRHFTLLCLPAASEACMRTIFSAILGGFFDTFFPADVKLKLLKPMVEAGVDVYLQVSAEMLPTPAKSHYTFNLRDLAKVFQGLLAIRPGQCVGLDPRGSLIRLWVHENLRVFHDRLVSPQDKSTFCQLLHELLRVRLDWREDYHMLFGPQAVMFGDYMRMGALAEERVYEEIPHGVRLAKLLDLYQEEYNAVAGRAASVAGALSLVFFADAVQHISRIARVLRQPRGSALLVGVGGSGKQSLTRFASFMADTQCHTIELTRNYGLLDFREDLKRLYRLVGLEGRQITFMFTDNHIVSEAFVEDINSLLNSGEITGLFAPDEKERIYAELRMVIPDKGGGESRNAMWQTFINRVRDGMHLVLCFSPVGPSFRSRCRQFPSLINCTTIDWFDEWPEEALLSVATCVLPLSELGGGSEVAELCVLVHASVANAAERYYQDLRRRFYVTPKSFLDLLHLYATLLSSKRQYMAVARERLLSGLAKLQETNITVDKMQREQNLLQPILQDKTESTQKLLAQVEEERARVTTIADAVSAEEQQVKMAQIETQMLADDAQANLEHVLPTLEAAEHALSALNKNDIIEIKTFTKPPALVLLTMEGVNILLQEKPDWDTAKRVLGDPSFIKRLVDYDKDNIPEKVIKTIKKVVDDPLFTPDQVAKQSKAAMSLCLWVRAMDTYSKIIKIVEPKRNALRTAQVALNEMNDELAAKQKQLVGVQAEVDGLEQQLSTTQGELASLQQQMDLSGKRLERASKLTSALVDESVRWRETADGLGDRISRLVGDVFLSAACISYIGAFNGPYREELVAGWTAKCVQLDISVSPGFSLSTTLASAVEIREWNIQGLPTDSLSTDNGILVTCGSRWPLMVDPQDQANRWVKAMESKNGLRTLRTTDAYVLRTLESCVRIGNPVLLEDVGETLDPALDPLLLKHTFMIGTRTLIRLGDSDVDYDPSFKFYMTTKMPNPHYMPEVCIKVNVINFTVTVQGLEDQLLGDVVRKERPDLEEAKDRLVLSISGDKRQLQDLEDRILKLLKESIGNILDDEILINTLNNAKQTAGIIQQRVREAEETEKQINTAREVYRPVPVRGSLIYFVIADLGRLDPMYQYSLAYFVQLFGTCLDGAAPHGDLSERLKALLEFTTEFMHKMVCRGLFERHKPLFSFLICTAIQRHVGAIASAEWDLLLRGGAAVEGAAPRPPVLAHWLAEPAWAAAQALEYALPVVFARLTKSLVTQALVYEAFTAAPEEPDAPAALQGVLGLKKPLSAFHVMLLVKALCDHKLSTAMQGYVDQHLGAQFSQSPPSSLHDVYSGSNPATPIIFILSQGADPVASIARFAESEGREPESLIILSLGQGQGPIAESVVELALLSGSWVVLQNCHLAKSWMPSLDRLVEGLQRRQAKMLAVLAAPVALPVVNPAAAVDSPSPDGEWDDPDEPDIPADGVHPEFRLWLTSMPVPHFPVAVLQNGIKITMEPPRGMRSNMLRTYDELPGGFLDRCAVQPAAWRKLVFACSFFHAALQERRRFGALGWNIPYDFSAGDLHCGLQTLHMFLTEAGEQEALTRRLALGLSHGAGQGAGGLPQNMVQGHGGTTPGSSHYGGAATPGSNTHRESVVPMLPLMSPATLASLPLSGPAVVPWDALLYVTGEINYGGRITDDNDRRLLMCILKQYYSDEALVDGHKLSHSGLYVTPPASNDRANYIAHLEALPYTEGPELFGMHANADITFSRQASRSLIDAILSIQPHLAPSGSGSSRAVSSALTTRGLSTISANAAIAAAAAVADGSGDRAVLRRAADLQASLPNALDPEKASVARNPFAALPTGHDNSLGTVLHQELARFNTLLGVLDNSLAELQRAVQGLAVMSPELETMAIALTNNQVPASWAQAAYPSLKPLASWMKDLVARVAALADWLYEGEPIVFWLPGFFFPQGFMTAALQNHARKTRMPIDRLAFDFVVLSEADSAAALRTTRPGSAAIAAQAAALASSKGSEGVLVHGLFLESARWDADWSCLAEARPNQIHSRLPVLRFLPAEVPVASASRSGAGSARDGPPPAPHYDCPLYKTSVRAGLLSTTGQSTNFVLHVALPLSVGSKPEFWIMRGVAALCSLDD